MDLSDYWLKHGGRSWKFFCLPRVADDSTLKLTSAILGRSTNLESLLKNAEESTITSAVEQLIDSDLCGYACESLYELNLSSVARSLMVHYPDSAIDLLSVLRRQASVEAIKFQQFDAKFLKFLDAIKFLEVDLIWLKGIVTSRTCYSNASLRLSSDFDYFIDPNDLEKLDEFLKSIDFSVITGDTGFCNQLGVGPVNTFNDICLAPVDDYVGSGIVGYEKTGWPIIDVKINPLDRGLKMLELERFKQQAITVKWKGQSFRAPDQIDQLLITLVHYEKDRFTGWKQLLDIKLLAQQVNNQPLAWSEFVRRSRLEGLNTACWAGLVLARERLGLSCVDDVINELSPRRNSALARALTFTVTPLFYWNTSSLPMLLLNAVVADDSARKLEVLKKSFLPKDQFLSRYYLRGKSSNALILKLALCLHWMVLLLPGGAVRRTVGAFVWSPILLGQAGEKTVDSA